MRLPSLLWLPALCVAFVAACGSSECPLGTHRAPVAQGASVCVANLQCGVGTTPDGGVCVPVVLCGAGTVADGGVCVPRLCDGSEDGGACVAPLRCAAGTRAQNGQCVPDPLASGPTTWRANQRVSRANTFSAEPSVAADEDGHVYVAFMEQNGDQSLQPVLLVSSDRGATFRRAGTYPSRDGFSGDVAVASGPNGAAYLAYIDYRNGTTASGYPPSDVYVVGSRDHGATWGTPVLLNTLSPDQFNDRPWIVAGVDGTVHVHWTNITNRSVSLTYYARSTDRGASFAEPVAIGDDNNFQTTPFSGIAVTPGGDVVIPAQLYAGGSAEDATSSVGFRVSTDGFEFPLTEFAAVYFTRDLQISAGPNLAIAPNGRACLVYIDAPERDPGVFFATASGDLAFGAARVIEEGKGTQTFPWVAADARGNCHAVWLDNRSGDWEVWSAVLRTDGTVAPSERVSDARFKEDGSREQWLGDFISVAVGGESRYAVWTDTRSGRSEVWFSSAPLSPP